MKNLFFPYYVNKGRLLDIYSILNRGYSEYEELTISSNDETKKNAKGDVSIEGGFKLFKIGGKAGDEKTVTDSDSTKLSVKKIQTIPSILKIVLDKLREKKYLRNILDAKDGDFVELSEVIFQINSVKYMMDEIDELLKLIEKMNPFLETKDRINVKKFTNMSKSIRALCNGEQLYVTPAYLVEL